MDMESLGPHQILFVEADSAIANLAEKLLSGWGLHVSIAGNSKEAIELTKKNLYDLILMAIQLGDIDGYETARIIRRLGDQFQSVPIIGHGIDPVSAAHKEHEFTDFILDPLNQTELYNKLKTYLDKAQPDIVMANLDRCTEGDPEFRRELAQLLANNMTELMANIEKALQANDPNIFIRAVHKTKTTLSILNDSEMNEEITTIQTKFKESKEDLERHAEKLINRCKKMIHILTALSVA
jgi:CheY-like chemotaxis protein/HPt (histidine-containing phosphotransfer) domain-containing protein